MILYIKVFIIALLSSLFFTPLAKKVAIKIGATDKPDERKIHKKEMPRLGGLAIFASFCLTSIFIFNHLENHIRGLVIGAFVIFICGVIDDIKPLSYKSKLLFQSLAVICLITNGVYIKNISFLTEGYNIGYLSIPFTFIWIIGITNAINLLDGIDGLACGVSGISSIFLTIIAVNNNNIPMAIIMTILSGSCFGFLPYNFKNAKIFMGDSGSLFLGFMLAAVSMQGTFKSATTFIIAPTILLGLPIYDTLNVIVRRKIKGVSIMKPDKEHFHHRLLAIGLSSTKITLIGYLFTTFLGIISLTIMASPKFTTLILLLGSFIILGCIVLENILYFKCKHNIKIRSIENEEN